MKTCFTCNKDLVGTETTVTFQDNDPSVEICPQCVAKLDPMWMPEFFGGRFDFVVYVHAFGLFPKATSKYHQRVIENCSTLEYAALMTAFRKQRPESELGNRLFHAIVAYQARIRSRGGFFSPEIRNRSWKITIPRADQEPIVLWRNGKCTAPVRDAYLAARDADLSL